MVWFGLVCRRFPELKVPNLHFSLMCSISFSEVPMTFEGGARATELKTFKELCLKQPNLRPFIIIIVSSEINLFEDWVEFQHESRPSPG